MITAEGAAQRQLRAQAAAIRDRIFGRSAVVRGVIEVTNICRVNCDYCPMRRDNTLDNAPRQREIRTGRHGHPEVDPGAANR